MFIYFDSNQQKHLISCNHLWLFQFRCCGVTNHTDWFEVYNATRVPDSCCLEYSDNCGLENPGTWWTAVRPICLASPHRHRHGHICLAS